MRGIISIAAGALLSFSAAAFAQDPAQIAAGDALYEQHCSSCHGEKLRSAGAMPDLRELPANARQHFDTMVLDGQGQMPAWRGQLSAQQFDQIWAYIRSRAR
jgi:mono/diheme cytochrome c family protein